MLVIIVMILEFLIKAFLIDLHLNDNQSNLIDFLMITALLIAIFMEISKKHKVKYAQMPLMVGALLRTALVIFDIFGRSIYVLPNSGADSEMFYRISVHYVTSHHSTRGAFPALMGTLFSFIRL